MLKNNNQEVLRRLSRRSMKAERTRNLFAVLAIVPIMEKQGGGIEYYNDNGFVVELLVKKV